jgi:hypothetical protein
MYYKIKVRSPYFVNYDTLDGLPRVNGASERGKVSDIPCHKGPRSLDVENVAREISGSKREQRE